MPVISLTVNDRAVQLEIDPDTPLLWALRDHLNLVGTKFGCGGGFCGACTVHLDGVATRACSTPIGKIAGRRVTTIEGLSANGDHPAQRAWEALDVPQCGYCQAGQIMSCAALLARTPDPSDDDIVSAMNGNICRCGTYVRIKQAVEARRVVEELAMRSRRDVLRDAKIGVIEESRRHGDRTRGHGGRSLPLASRRPAGCWSRCAAEAIGAQMQMPAPTGPLAFPIHYIQIDPDDRVLIWSAQPEMGEGTKTSLPMLVAEELDADWTKVRIDDAPLDRKYGGQGVGGSDAIRSDWDALRRVGATARALSRRRRGSRVERARERV